MAFVLYVLIGSNENGGHAHIDITSPVDCSFLAGIHAIQDGFPTKEGGSAYRNAIKRPATRETRGQTTTATALVQVRQQIAQQQRKIDGEAMRHAQAVESDFGPLNSATEDEQNQKLLLQLGHKEKQILAALKGQ